MGWARQKIQPKTLRKQPKTASINSSWAYIQDDLLLEGFLRLRFEGVIFGRAIFGGGLLSEFCPKNVISSMTMGAGLCMASYAKVQIKLKSRRVTRIDSYTCIRELKQLHVTQKTNFTFLKLLRCYPN